MMSGMSGMPSGMQPPVSGASIPPSRPLFPSAAVSTSAASTVVSVSGSAPLGTDFKPITSVASGGSSIGPVKPTFPAYSSAGEAGVSAAANNLAGGGDQKVNLIATTGAASKIIHPPEDLSLVSLYILTFISNYISSVFLILIYIIGFKIHMLDFFISSSCFISAFLISKNFLR